MSRNEHHGEGQGWRPARQEIGLAGLHHLAPPLIAAGFTVHSAEDYREAAAVIRTELDRRPLHERFPIVAAEMPGVGPWITAAASRTSLAVVMAHPDASEYPAGVIPISNGGVLDDVLAKTGWWSPLGDEDGQHPLTPPAATAFDPQVDYTTPRSDRPAHTTPTDSASQSSSESVFGAFTAQTRRGVRTATYDAAEVIVVISGKGGAGKTTMAMTLAQRAAEADPTLRVVLVDANRGQGDVRTYLRVGSAPSVYDAAVGLPPATAILSAQALGAARTGRHPSSVAFATVLAPTGGQAQPDVVTAGVYRGVIDYARSIADLVVVDTQIIEASDPSDMVQRLIVPLLTSGAFALGVTDDTSAGAVNLHDRVVDLQNAGLTANRTMIALNKATPQFDVSHLAAVFGRLGTVISPIQETSEVKTAMQAGSIETDEPTIRTAANAILHRVLGTDEFSPAYGSTTTSSRHRWTWRSPFRKR